jgi:hypothetical protein
MANGPSVLAFLLALKLARDFDNLGLHVDHAIRPNHFARERSTLEFCLNGFELSIGIDEAEVQMGAIQSRPQYLLSL